VAGIKALMMSANATCAFNTTVSQALAM